MRAYLITFVAACALVACGSKKPKVDEPKPDDTATTKPDDKPTQTADPNATPVSPNLAVSADLAAQCGLKANTEVPPNFAYDQVELLPEDRAVLEQIATCLTTGPLKGKGLNLIGRADPRGTEERSRRREPTRRPGRRIAGSTSSSAPTEPAQAPV
jgi:peptidoglycan-associated lipoprotein